jgi:hypothetical protein
VTGGCLSNLANSDAKSSSFTSHCLDRICAIFKETSSDLPKKYHILATCVHFICFKILEVSVITIRIEKVINTSGFLYHFPAISEVSRLFSFTTILKILTKSAINIARSDCIPFIFSSDVSGID